MNVCARGAQRARGVMAGLGWLVVLLAAVAAGCSRPRTVLGDLVEARRLAEQVQGDLARSQEAAGRAVMATTEESAQQAAASARQATAQTDATWGQLLPILESLGYRPEMEIAARFQQTFGELKAQDDEVLTLAVESSNLKAQRLSFNDARQEADAVMSALQRAVPAGASAEAKLAAAAVREQVLQIQAVQPRHIWEVTDERMTELEAEMATASRDGREALRRLGAALPRSGAAMADATAALDRFDSLNQEIVRLSRRNSNVRSLALTLGQRRVLAARCEADLRELSDALAQHQLGGTR